MEQLQGQMNIFDFLDPNKDTPKEPPTLLEIGQRVFRVIKGDIFELEVYNEKSWLCGEGERGYRLYFINPDGCYDCTWNREIGVNVFTHYEEALISASEYLSNNKVILATDIKAAKTEAYKYIFYDKEYVCFYSMLDDETIYCSFGGSYQHISNNVKSELEKWERAKQQKLRDCKDTVELIDYIPTYKNMYPVKGKDEWKYAEARYQELRI